MAYCSTGPGVIEYIGGVLFFERENILGELRIISRRGCIQREGNRIEQGICLLAPVCFPSLSVLAPIHLIPLYSPD